MRFDPPSAKTLNRAVSLVLSASKTAFADSLECITLKGSAIKGDFIRGYSDLDFHVFLKPEAMDGEKSPKLDEAIRFQKTFGDVEPEDFDASQFQIYFINSEKYPSDWIPPVKGTFKVYWGILPLVAKEADDSTYVRFAKQFLSDVTEDKKKLVERFVDKPDTLVPTVVRLLGATVKGHMYSVAVLLTEKPKYAFKMKLDALIPLVEKGLESKGHFSAFFERVVNWQLVKQDHEYARETFMKGTEALDEIACWFRG